VSDLGFPLKDLSRRGFQTALAVAGLTMCTATTVFLVAFGESLGLGLTLLAGGGLTSGFSYIFSAFVLVVALLGFLAGAAVVSFLVSASMSERVRDVGVMKATGGTAEAVFSYFLTELSIVVFAGCGAGVLLGLLAKTGCIILLNWAGFHVPQRPPNPWVVLLIFAAFVLASHILGIRPIRRATKVEPAQALSPLFSLEANPRPAGTRPSRMGLTFKIAYRGLLRRRSATQRAILCLSVVLTLTSVAVVGGAVASQTTQNYAERAVGRDVVLIAHPDLARRYLDLHSRFLGETGEAEPVDYLNSDYLIPESVIDALNSTQVRLDPRLVLEATVQEVPGYIIDPKEPTQYVQVGDHRSRGALVLGLDPRRVVSDWLTLGRFLNETDRLSAVVGDSLALGSFENPLKQRVRVLGEDFEIVGECLDPLNNGDVAYVPLDALFALVDRAGYNLLLVKIDPSRYSEAVADVEGLLAGTGLELSELNGVLNRHLGLLGRLWATVMLLPLSSIVTAVLCLLSYTMLSITGEQRELGIMRALGAKPRTVQKVILTETALLMLVSGSVGVTAGILLTWMFLVPEAVVAPSTLLLTLGGLLLAMAAICLTSLYPARRVTKQPVAGVLSQP